MPFTPFHFGPGLLAKAILPRHFSWCAFVAAQVVIDLEPLYYMIKKEYPIHRFAHTFLGATLVGIGLALFLVGFRLFLSKSVPTLEKFLQNHDLLFRSESSFLGLWVGSLVGAITHPLFDGIMHTDMHPFRPWSEQTPYLHLIPTGTLHLVCLSFGAIGFCLLAIKFIREARWKEKC